MDAIFAALEGSAPAMYLKASFVAYPLVNAAHILAIGVLLSSVILMDLRIMGIAGGRRAAPDPFLRRVAVSAFLVAAITGLSLFSIRAGEYAQNPAFLTKLVLLAVAGANLALFAAVAGRAPALSRVLAGISLLVWPCVLVAGRFIGFV